MFENIYEIEKIVEMRKEEIRQKAERQHLIDNAFINSREECSRQTMCKKIKEIFQPKEMKKMLSIIIIILILLSLILFAGKSHMYIMVEKQRELLRSLSTDLSGKIYKKEQIKGLPTPVQSYFQNVLTDGQPYISSVYMKHDGRFKTALDREWINIEGEQFFSMEEPGFLWKGNTALFSVQDMYISGEGQIKVSLLNLFKIFDKNGPRYNQGELLRWLGESVWFPTNLLPGSRLQWFPIDENTAELYFSYRDQNLSYKVSFNTEGEITELETQRYMGDNSLETWIGRLSSYKEINGMRVPMRIEAFWKLADGEHSYAQFNVRKINHN